ncbi:MAG: hypothetical protein L3J34_11620 [Flavobacteriaceae bacterium]|nr:hypothetical protein [Flavobacteriaceae bacterium]
MKELSKKEMVKYNGSVDCETFTGLYFGVGAVLLMASNPVGLGLMTLGAGAYFLMC